MRVARNRAAGGTVLIMAPKTGEILALANEPTFNPNAFSSASPEQRRNRAVQDIYEPGSTFKVVTASAALEEHVIGVDDIIDVSGGKIRFGSRVIDDTHDYGSLSFTDVIVKSSNVGAIKVGLSLGAGAARAVRAPIRIRPRAVAGFSWRDDGHRVGSATSSTTARSRRCRWATRSA